MKHLANCGPREFLRQTHRICQAAEKWLDWERLKALRRPMAEGVSAGEQIQKNAMAMLDELLEAHPDEVAELLGLMCFIEPEDLDKHSAAELIGAFGEMLGCPEVVGFFTSSARWAGRSTAGAAGR